MLCNNYYIKKLIGFKGIILEQLETSSDSMSFPFFLWRLKLTALQNSNDYLKEENLPLLQKKKVL